MRAKLGLGLFNYLFFSDNFLFYLKERNILLGAPYFCQKGSPEDEVGRGVVRFSKKGVKSNGDEF